MKANKFIDIVKLLMAYIIAFHHSFLPGFSADSGYFACEFFFFVAGFFMMKKACSIRVQDQKIASDTTKYVLSKYFNLLPLLLCTFFFSFLAYITVGHQPVLHVLKICLLSFHDIFLLQMLGFGGDVISGYVWFLSAMLIAMTILYPLCLKFKESVSPFFLLISLTIYGFLFATDLGLKDANVVYGFIYKGTLRGIAGLTAGCAMYQITVYLNKLSLKKIVRQCIVYSAMLCIFLSMFLMLAVRFIGQHNLLIFVLLFFSLPPLLCWKEVSNNLIPFGTESLRDMSICLYLNHFCWAYSLHTLSLPVWKHCVYFLILSGINTLIVVYLKSRLINCSRILYQRVFAAEQKNQSNSGSKV